MEKIIIELEFMPSNVVLTTEESLSKWSKQIDNVVRVATPLQIDKVTIKKGNFSKSFEVPFTGFD